MVPQYDNFRDSQQGSDALKAAHYSDRYRDLGLLIALRAQQIRADKPGDAATAASGADLRPRGGDSMTSVPEPQELVLSRADHGNADLRGYRRHIFAWRPTMAGEYTKHWLHLSKGIQCRRCYG